MINFYKNSGGVGTIQFASGEVVTLSDDVSIRADNTTNLIIISEFNKDKFWISTAGPLQVNGVAITGTNQQKVDLIAPVFAEVAGTAAGVTSYADLTNKPTIPTTLDQIVDTATRLAVSPTEKTTWNAKQPAGSYALSSQIPTDNNQLANGAGYVTAAGLPASILLSKYITRETPTGLTNNSNVTFTLANLPIVGSEMVFRNGSLMDGGGNDYSISGATITFITAPVATAKIRVTYIKQ